MNLTKYDYNTDSTCASFTFQSVGPKGIIEKIVTYTPIDGFVILDGKQVTNLAFGDLDREKNEIDDLTTSNNNDRDKILATVAATVVAYTSRHGQLPIYFQGSTAARTRLYQMGINANLAEIQKLFEIRGLLNRRWLAFVPGVNFEAFLAIRK
ncbi:DUF6934 family protein [Chitinophaga barathri]|uniref:Uncharacterized protein n=1 Tax=Chitinophaga barathri TaxID=1647451 RepID=A0A3N4N5A6_9BACT|nr:hypothetical protein [Chitinophaga barathri]RPD42813.1 hypothetical protein EG028_00505 [Chitinophaga barathri]